MPNDATAKYEEMPNHMIIWLDDSIGDLGYYQHLKKAFSTKTDPKNEAYIELCDKDYGNILRVEGPLPVHFEGVYFLLAAFTNIESCIHCFEQNQDKRIFFITSGALGKEAVPLILSKFRQTFTDPITNKPYVSIYVFCHNIGYHTGWAYEYRSYIHLFDFDADLLSRMVHDIADYFLMTSKQLLAEEPRNSAAAYNRLSWAKELFERYRKMEHVSVYKELNEVDQLIVEVENELKSSSSSEEEEDDDYQ